MIDNVVDLLQTRKRLRERKLLDKIDDIENLPTLPDIFSRLVEAISDEEPFAVLAEIVDQDVAISTKILNLANSALYGFQPTSSLHRAVMILGTDQLRDIVLTFSFTNQMRWNSDQIQYLKQISIHSLLVNRFTHELQRMMSRKPFNDEFSSVGITHDIGKIVQMQYFPNEFQEIIDFQEKNPEYNYYQSEIELGHEMKTHSEIGAYLLRNWKVPDSHCQVALKHHNPIDASGEMKEFLDVFSFVDDTVDFIWRYRDKETWDINKFPRVYNMSIKKLKHLGDRIFDEMKELMLV
jgi:HD-like signal output (HDOD) protein